MIVLNLLKLRTLTIYTITLSIIFQIVLISVNASTNTDIKVYFNGTKINFDAASNDSPPYIKDGRTLIPFRRIFEAFGMEVEWYGNDRLVKAKNSTIKMELKIGQKHALLNNSKKELDVAPEITDNRTFVPLRFVSESIGAQVKWDEITRSVYITFNQDKSAQGKLSLGQEMSHNNIKFSVDILESQNNGTQYIVYGRTNSKDAKLLIEIEDEIKSFSGVVYISEEELFNDMYKYTSTIYTSNSFTPKIVYVSLYENKTKIRVAQYNFHLSKN